MADDEAQLTALGLAIDQVADLLDRMGAEDAGKPTACGEWTLGELADHIVDGAAGFAAKLRDGDASGSGTGDWGARMRANGAELLSAWDEVGVGSVPMGPDWQSAELAVHAWDLATALGESTVGLDPAPAERGLAFMKANLTDDIRGDSFGPAQPAPDGADPYGRIAAFAGRRV